MYDLQIYLAGGMVILITMTLLWLLSLVIRDASIVDIFWGTGFVIVAWFYHQLSITSGSRHWLVLALVTIWGLRLSLHLAARNLGKGEDFRYRRWREENGERWWWLSFLRVFLLQGIVMWLVSAPLFGVFVSSSGSLSIVDAGIFTLWLIGFGFEAMGDWQLTRFRSDARNAGKVLDTGLWRYTRHPNYFGDAVQWWAFYLFALLAGAWWTIFSPAIMTYLLMRVSGVAMLEKSLKRSKPAYEEYVEKTSAFFPMPPKD